jgi:hypothetical protein
MTARGHRIRARNKLSGALEFQKRAQVELARAEEMLAQADEGVRLAQRDLAFAIECEAFAKET